MNPETYGLMASLLVQAGLLTLYVYIVIVSQDTLASMQTYKDTLSKPENKEERAVVENEMKYYQVVNGASIVMAALTGLSMVFTLLGAGIDAKESNSKSKSKPKARKKPKSARL